MCPYLLGHPVYMHAWAYNAFIWSYIIAFISHCRIQLRLSKRGFDEQQIQQRTEMLLSRLVPDLLEKEAKQTYKTNQQTLLTNQHTSKDSNQESLSFESPQKHTPDTNNQMSIDYDQEFPLHLYSHSNISSALLSFPILYENLDLSTQSIKTPDRFSGSKISAASIASRNVTVEQIAANVLDDKDVLLRPKRKSVGNTSIGFNHFMRSGSKPNKRSRVRNNINRNRRRKRKRKNRRNRNRRRDKRLEALLTLEGDFLQEEGEEMYLDCCPSTMVSPSTMVRLFIILYA